MPFYTIAPKYIAILSCNITISPKFGQTFLGLQKSFILLLIVHLCHMHGKYIYMCCFRSAEETRAAFERHRPTHVIHSLFLFAKLIFFCNSLFLFTKSTFIFSQYFHFRLQNFIFFCNASDLLQIYVALN